MSDGAVKNPLVKLFLYNLECQLVSEIQITCHLLSWVPEAEPQTLLPMFITGAFYIADTVVIQGQKVYSVNQYSQLNTYIFYTSNVNMVMHLYVSIALTWL